MRPGELFPHRHSFFIRLCPTATCRFKTDAECNMILQPRRSEAFLPKDFSLGCSPCTERVRVVPQVAPSSRGIHCSNHDFPSADKKVVLQQNPLTCGSECASLSC